MSTTQRDSAQKEIFGHVFEHVQSTQNMSSDPAKLYLKQFLNVYLTTVVLYIYVFTTHPVSFMNVFIIAMKSLPIPLITRIQSKYHPIFVTIFCGVVIFVFFVLKDLIYYLGVLLFSSIKYYINKFKHKTDYINSKEYIKIKDTLFNKAILLGFDAAVIMRMLYITSGKVKKDKNFNDKVSKPDTEIYNKSEYFNIFSKCNIPQPLTSICKYDKQLSSHCWIQDNNDNDNNNNNGKVSTFEDLLSYIKNNGKNKIVVKPEYGFLGRGQVLFEKNENNDKFYDFTQLGDNKNDKNDINSVKHLDENELKLEIEKLVTDKKKTHLIQPYVASNDLNNNHFVLRFITYRDDNNNNDSNNEIVPLLADMIISCQSWTSHNCDYIFLLDLATGKPIGLVNDYYNLFNDKTKYGDYRSFESIEKNINLREYNQVLNKDIFENSLKLAIKAHKSQYAESCNNINSYVYLIAQCFVLFCFVLLCLCFAWV